MVDRNRNSFSFHRRRSMLGRLKKSCPKNKKGCFSPIWVRFPTLSTGTRWMWLSSSPNFYQADRCVCSYGYNDLPRPLKISLRAVLLSFLFLLRVLSRKSGFFQIRFYWATSLLSFCGKIVSSYLKNDYRERFVITYDCTVSSSSYSYPVNDFRISVGANKKIESKWVA